MKCVNKHGPFASAEGVRKGSVASNEELPASFCCLGNLTQRLAGRLPCWEGKPRDSSSVVLNKPKTDKKRTLALLQGVPFAFLRRRPAQLGSLWVQTRCSVALGKQRGYYRLDLWTSVQPRWSASATVWHDPENWHPVLHPLLSVCLLVWSRVQESPCPLRVSSKWISSEISVSF